MNEAMLVEDHSRLLATAQRDLAEARAILRDLLEERGESWLAQLADRRGYLYQSLRPHDICPVCSSAARLVCSPRCSHALNLRIVGGSEETQRQVDAAHEAALAHAWRGQLAPWRREYAAEWVTDAPRLNVTNNSEHPVRLYSADGALLGEVPPRLDQHQDVDSLVEVTSE